LCDSLPSPKILTLRSRVLVLQHPGEVKESKGTVPLCTMSFDERCFSVVVGRKFDRENLPDDVVAAADDRTRNTAAWRRILLLWPSGESEQLTSGSLDGIEGVGGEESGGGGALLVVLDGTWKSCQQMFNVSPMLHVSAAVTSSPFHTAPYQQKSNMLPASVASSPPLRVRFAFTL
jgi:DTW domain-containing protein YfiP